MNPRQTVFELLMAWSRGRRWAEELLEQRNPPERAFVQELFYGCIRQKLALETLIAQHAAKRPGRAAALLLQIGLYQLLFMRVPAHAAVHETVELAKQHLSAAEAKFVNAVLRRCAENDATYVAFISTLRETRPWAGYSHPRWLFERWERRWGRAAAVALCEWNNTPPPIYARGEQPWPGVVEPTPFHPLCYRVIEPERFFANPGRYYVQDPSALIAVDVLDPQPGESVLDLCAAPGGKTTYIAQKMQNRGRILATDCSAARLKLLAQNCRRLGVEIVTIATEPPAGQFDRVLVDAPCSNTGVMRRRVDVRWRIRPEQLPRLAALQKRLLKTGWDRTRPGGVLVYSTCSIEPEENEQVIATVAGVELVRATVPPRDPMDGVFVARWRKP